MGSFTISVSDSCSGVCNVEEQERRVYLMAHIYSSYCLALELQWQCPGQTRSLSCLLRLVHLCLQGYLPFVISDHYSFRNTHRYAAILCCSYSSESWVISVNGEFLWHDLSYNWQLTHLISNSSHWARVFYCLDRTVKTFMILQKIFVLIKCFY